jgi:hypothetical protein
MKGEYMEEPDMVYEAFADQSVKNEQVLTNQTR